MIDSRVRVKFRIRNIVIIEILYYTENIEYIDITPYNFIEKNEKIYIIDFGHANYRKAKNYFLREFLDGLNKWNSDFL